MPPVARPHYGDCAEISSVFVYLEFDYSHVPEGSFKVADPDGNVIDITEREDEWDGVRL